MLKHEEKPGFISTLILSVVLGAIVGIVDLWAFEFSAKSFYGGLAAGVTWFVSFAAINYFLPQGINLIQRILWYFSGGLAGLVWWIVIRPPSLKIWMAILGGIIIAAIWWFAEGMNTKRKELAS